MMYWFIWVVALLFDPGAGIGTVSNAGDFEVYPFEESRSTALPADSLVQNSIEETSGSSSETIQNVWTAFQESAANSLPPEFHTNLFPVKFPDAEYQIRSHIFPFHCFW